MPENTESGQNDTSTGKESQAEGTLLTSKAQSQTEDTGTAGDQGGEQKAGEQPAIPETYEFKVPEGIELDTAFATKAGEVFKELGLSQEKADALTALYADRLAAEAKESAVRFAQMKEAWVAEIKADKEIGGKNYDQSVATALKTVEKFGTPAFVKFLDESGMGSHPDMIRFCRNVGLHLVEDRPGAGDSSESKQEMHDKLYADTTPSARVG